LALNLTSVRRAAERLLLADECIVYKGPDRLGSGVWDEVTSTYTAPDEQVEYEGICNISKINNFPSEIMQGAAPEIETNYYLKIPADLIVDVRKDDIVVCTSVHAGGDPMLVGMTFTTDAAPEVSTYTVLRAIRIKKFEEVPQ
jgi:hypothetical protein